MSLSVMALTSTASAVDALLRAKLKITLAEFIKEQQTQGHSNERIARELYQSTDGDIDVVANTIRNWINDLEAVA